MRVLRPTPAVMHPTGRDRRTPADTPGGVVAGIIQAKKKRLKDLELIVLGYAGTMIPHGQAGSVGGGLKLHLHGGSIASVPWASLRNVFDRPPQQLAPAGRVASRQLRCPLAGAMS